MCIFYIFKVSDKKQFLKSLLPSPAGTGFDRVPTVYVRVTVAMATLTCVCTATEQQQQKKKGRRSKGSDCNPLSVLLDPPNYWEQQTGSQGTKREKKKCIRPNMNNCYWTNWNDESGNNGEHDDEYQSYTDEQRDRSLPYLLELSWSIHHHQDTSAQYQVRNVLQNFLSGNLQC